MLFAIISRGKFALYCKEIVLMIYFSHRKNPIRRGDKMLLYSIIMFLAALPMLGISIAIYRGKTDLIHDYHQTKVTDKSAYGKAFGKAMLLVSSSMFLSGRISLFGDSEKLAMVSVGVLFIGIVIGIVAIVAVQIKYNKGVF